MYSISLPRNTLTLTQINKIHISRIENIKAYIPGMVGSPVTSGAMKQECWSMEINHIKKN